MYYFECKCLKRAVYRYGQCDYYIYETGIKELLFKIRLVKKYKRSKYIDWKGEIDEWNKLSLQMHGYRNDYHGYRFRKDSFALYIYIKNKLLCKRNKK